MDIQLKLKKYPPLDIVAPVVFSLVFAVTMLYSHFEPHVQDVDMIYVMSHKDEPGFVLLDVRDEDIYDGRAPFSHLKVPPFEGVPGGHIPSAINFPFSDLNVAAASAALAKVGVTKDKTIILYCNTGGLSTRFADNLVRRFNFSPSRIKNYRGSIRDWISRPQNRLLPEDHDEPYYSQKYIYELNLSSKTMK
ncbi:MAG: hypothetical protein IJS40_02095 [Synergistaceae bacterium]|nr:hypothetical protein [Synergistaceae bacterium]